MELCKIQESDHAYLEALLIEAFPPKERPPFPMLLEQTAQGTADFWVIREENRSIGLAYLLPFDDAALPPLFVSNEVVVSDNAIEWQLNEAATHERVTETVQNALAMSDCPLFQAAGFEGNVYAGVIANSPRPAEALRYLQYLSSDVRP